MKMTDGAFQEWCQRLQLPRETGHWRCPPGETYASHLGLTYRLRSSAEFQPVEIQNLKFL